MGCERRVAGTPEARKCGHIVVAEEEEPAPCKSFVPVRETMFTTPAETVPEERSKPRVLIWNSWTVSAEKSLRGAAGDTVVDSRTVDRNHGHLLRGYAD